SRIALTKRLPRRRHGCDRSAIGGRGRGPLFASPGAHATSTTATAKARNAGDLALPPGQALSRVSWLRGEGRNLQLRSRREPRRRLGDPVLGGSCKAPIMTAYRQQALACAASLSSGPRRTSEIKTAVPDAPKILLRNVYGWFFRVERGKYALTQEGTAALSR